MTMARLRIVPPPPTVQSPPGQACFAWMELVIVVHPYRPRRNKVACKAPAPRAPKTKRKKPQQLALTARTASKPPIRPADLRPYTERRLRTGVKPKSLGTGSLGARARKQLDADVAELEAAGVYALRPRRGNGVEGDCVPGPCYWIRCRSHLKYEVDPVTHAIKDNFPGIELEAMRETCSLRVADMVEDSGEVMSWMDVASYLNMHETRAEQIGGKAMEKAALEIERLRRLAEDTD